MLVRAIRGATTVLEDSKAAITEATLELLKKMMLANKLEEGDLISILFTATGDLTSEFPATAARQMGLANTPLICATEISVPGSLPRTLRVLIHAYSELSKEKIEHIYLREAINLRRDISK